MSLPPQGDGIISNPRIIRQLDDITVNNSTAHVNTNIFVDVKLGKSYYVLIFADISSSAIAKSKLRWNEFNFENLALFDLFSKDTGIEGSNGWGDNIVTPGAGGGVIRVEILKAIRGDTTLEGRLTLTFAQNTPEATNTKFYGSSYALIWEIG